MVMGACQTGVTVGPKLASDQTLRVMIEDQPASLDPGQTQYTYETAALCDPKRDAANLDPALATLGLKADDDLTFQVQLERHDPALMWLAALPAGAPIRKDVLTKSGDKWATAPETLVTNGPFHVTEMAKNDHITVERNTHYWGAKPTLTRISFAIVNDGAAALTKYKKGDLDVMTVEPAQAASVASDATLSRQLIKTPNLTVFWTAYCLN